MGRIAIAIGG